MISTPIQTAFESLTSLASPDEETLKFTLFTIDLILMVQMNDIDYKSDYRNALVWTRESVQLELDRIETRRANVLGEFHD